MSKSEHPDRRLPDSKVSAKVRKATCQKCGAVETKPSVNGVCELRAVHPWVGRCVNGIVVKGDQYVSTRMVRRSSV